MLTIVVTNYTLFQQQLCKWPQCDQPCESIATFIHHLSTTHIPDTRGLEQLGAQGTLLQDLEERIKRERVRYHAMWEHLTTKRSPDTINNQTISSTTGTISSTNSIASPVIISNDNRNDPFVEQV